MRSSKILFALLVSLMILQLVGCQRDYITEAGTGAVELTVIWPSVNDSISQTTTISCSSENAVLFGNLVAPDGIIRIDVVIGGPGMSAVIGSFDATTGEGTMPAVQAGPNRIARVIAYDANNVKHYAGQSEPFDIDANASVAVTVEMAVVNNPPSAPSNPTPADGDTNVSLRPTLGWDASVDPDGDAVTYDVYVGLSTNPQSDPLFESHGLTTNSCIPYPAGSTEGLPASTAIYWQVVASDGYLSTTGSVWQFTTAEATELAANPDQDAYVDSAFPSTNYGSNVIFYASDFSGSGYQRKSYIRFDLSPLPESAVVTTATLRLFKSTSNPITGQIELQCRRVGGAWTESGITWNNKPSFDTTGSSQVRVNLADSAGTSYDFDVTYITQMMVSGTVPNNGYEIRVSAAAVDSEVAFHSRESVSSQYRPVLIVQYSH